MVTRTYKCDTCGNFDYEQSIKENNLTICPYCGSYCERDYSNMKESLFFDLPAFNDIEVNKPEWKRKGRRWIPEHKIKGLN